MASYLRVYPGSPAIPVLQPIETFPAVDKAEIGASIPGFPGDGNLPAPGLVFVGPPVEPLEVGPYNELSGRSRGDGLDIDHIPSRWALEEYLLENFADMTPSERRGYVERAPSIAIRAEVHRKYSETYGGRNTTRKRSQDASDLKQAVNQNFDAIKLGLLDSGLDEGNIEIGRERLHTLHKQQGVLMDAVKVMELIAGVGRTYKSLLASGIIPAQSLVELYPGCDRLDLEVEDGVELTFWYETKILDSLFFTLMEAMPTTVKYKGKLPAPYRMAMTQSDVHALFGQPMESRDPIKMPEPVGQTGG